MACWLGSAGAGVKLEAVLWAFKSSTSWRHDLELQKLPVRPGFGTCGIEIVSDQLQHCV